MKNINSILSILLLSGILFFTSCNKDSMDQPLTPTKYSGTSSSKYKPSQLKAFHSRMKSIIHGEIVTRTDSTRTFNDFLPLVSETLGFIYSNQTRINNQFFHSKDTISITYSNNVNLSLVDQASIYDDVFGIIQDRYGKSNEDSTFYIGCFVRSLTRGSTSGTIEVSTTFANEIARGSAGLAPTLPDDRYFGYWYDCDFSTVVPGAAYYLQTWLKQKNPTVSTGSNKYVGGIVVAQDQYWGLEWSDNIHESTNLFDNNKTLNSGDPTPNDGSIDHVGFYWYADAPWSPGATTCIDQTEMNYHGPAVNSLVLADELSYWGKGSFLGISVTDCYIFHELGEKDKMELYWGYWLEMASLYPTEEPHIPLAIESM